MHQRVLITGAAGLIGDVLRRGLAEDYSLSGLDAKGRGLFRARGSNMRNLASVLEQFAHQDAVVDLAADASATAGWESVYGNNLLATFNAFEASRRCGVRRLVFASSTRVTGLYERESPYAAIVEGRYEHLEKGAIPMLKADAPIRPDGLYAVGKAFGEALGRLYADEHGLSVICLRLGTVNAADLVRLVRCAIDAPDELRFAVFYGVSNNTWRFWDLTGPLEAIGYEPQDNAETWREWFAERGLPQKVDADVR